MEVFEEAFGELIDPSARLERVADGFVFIEGPVWDFGARHLTFSDLVGNIVYRYDETGGARVYRQPSDFSNGMTLDDEGNLVVCEHRTRRVSRETPSGFETVVDRYEGKRLNSPNDVVPARDGSLLFTDPPFGLTEEYRGLRGGPEAGGPAGDRRAGPEGGQSLPRRRCTLRGPRLRDRPLGRSAAGGRGQPHRALADAPHPGGRHT